MSFDPDWTVSPAAILREWLEEHGITPGVLAGLARTPHQKRNETHEAIDAVLLKHPITVRIARILERGTGIHMVMWLRLDELYRQALAQGKREME